MLDLLSSCGALRGCMPDQIARLLGRLVAATRLRISVPRPHPTIPQTSRHPARVRPRGAIPAQAAKCTPDQRQAPQILRSRARSEETDGAPKILMAPAVSSLHARALDAHSGFFTCCRGVFLHLLSRSVSSLVVAECFFTCCRRVFLHLLSGSVSSLHGFYP